MRLLPLASGPFNSAFNLNSCIYALTVSLAKSAENHDGVERPIRLGCINSFLDTQSAEPGVAVAVLVPLASLDTGTHSLPE